MMDMHKYKRLLVMLCLLLAVLGVGCGGSDSDDMDASSGGGSSATGGEGSGGSSTATGGNASGGAMTGGANETGGALEPTPPPEMPRELGSPDGIYCESTFTPPPETCAAGSRCCPNDDTLKVDQVCMEDAAKCPPCDGLTCAQLLCDGPEDCSTGDFCCFAELGSCKNNPDDCNPATAGDGMWPFKTVECRSRCVSNDPRDPDHGVVVCKDDRDCPGPYVEGRCKPLNIGELPNGISVCSGP